MGTYLNTVFPDKFALAYLTAGFPKSSFPCHLHAFIYRAKTDAVKESLIGDVRLELTRTGHQNLNLGCLPIPPAPHKIDACHSFSPARVSIVPYYSPNLRCDKSFSYLTFQGTFFYFDIQSYAVFFITPEEQTGCIFNSLDLHWQKVNQLLTTQWGIEPQSLGRQPSVITFIRQGQTLNSFVHFLGSLITIAYISQVMTPITLGGHLWSHSPDRRDLVDSLDVYVHY